MKLELKHLVGYLPYGLKGISTEENLGFEIVKGFSTYGKNDTISLITNVDDIDLVLFKPILRPLSDLTKEIEVNGEKFVPIEILKKFYGEDFELKYHTSLMFGTLNLPYIVIEKLLEWHFDIYRLIENGLAISIHDVEEAGI